MPTAPLQEKSKPNDARQVRSRKALRGALLSLLEEKAFDQITIREISARAGTGYATFFRHYPQKEALLGDVATEQISRLLALTIPVLMDTDSLTSSRTLCAHVANHRKLWIALLTGGASAIVREEFIRQARTLDRSELAGPTNDWLPADLGIVHGTGGTFDMLAWWLSQDEGAYSSDEIATILHRLIIEPLIGKGKGA